jgi:hypothetical protein
MKFKLLSLSAVVLTCAMLILASCKSINVGVSSDHKHKPGPPPHAPAHGYRQKHHGMELIYDSGLGVYVVVDFPNHYYCKGHYYRLRGIQWEVCVHLDGPWKSVSEKLLPPGLRGKEKGKGKSKEHPGRGRGVQKKKK